MNESPVIGVSMTPQIVMPLNKEPGGSNVGQLFLIGRGTLLVHEDGTKSKVEHGIAGVVYRRVESTESYNMKIAIFDTSFNTSDAYFRALPPVNG